MASDGTDLTDTQKLQLVERANEIYRQQLHFLQDHAASLRSILQDKDNIIENLVLRYDLGIIHTDSRPSNNDLSTDQPDDIEMKQLRRKAEHLAQRTILENFELREMVNELRDENFHLRNEIFALQDKINRQVLQINKLEKKFAGKTGESDEEMSMDDITEDSSAPLMKRRKSREDLFISEEAIMKRLLRKAKIEREDSVKPPHLFGDDSDSEDYMDYMDEEAWAKRLERQTKYEREESVKPPNLFTDDSDLEDYIDDIDDIVDSDKQLLNENSDTKTCEDFLQISDNHKYLFSYSECVVLTCECCPGEETDLLELKQKLGRFSKLLNVYIDRIGIKESIYLKFDSVNDAQKAINNLNGKSFMFRKMKASYMNEGAYDYQFRLRDEILELRNKLKEEKKLWKPCASYIEHENRYYSNRCGYLRNAFSQIKRLGIPLESLDPSNDKCFCDKCHRKRGDSSSYTRGNPSKKYALPIGWARIGLNVDQAKCKLNNVWSDWNVAFHATNNKSLRRVFKSGLQLLKPGDRTIDGEELSIKPGHINRKFKRYNYYAKQSELFDPNQIFLSPSIKYSSYRAYAEYSKLDNGIEEMTHVFQVRIRPNSYKIGQETINATKQGRIIDYNFNNNELEWYTKENVGIVIYGLLIKIT